MHIAITPQMVVRKANQIRGETFLSTRFDGTVKERTVRKEQELTERQE